MSATQRISIHDVDPAAYRAVLGLEKYVNTGNLGGHPGLCQGAYGLSLRR
ncbi:MAG: hypothetical protein ACREQM_02355 [Candidatus Dormibacteraceae bacterium]